MKKTIIIAILVFTLMVCAFGCTSIDYNEEIIVGGEFDYDDVEDLNASWIIESGEVGEGSSVFTVLDEEDKVKINTSTAGWAYIAQEVKLNNNSYYKITYTFESTSMTKKGEDNYYGLYVGFLEDEYFNYKDEEGSVLQHLEHRSATTTPTKGEIYFHTKNTTLATIAIYVGREDLPVNTTVTLDNISLVKVRKSDIAPVVDPETNKEVLPVWELDANVFGANTINNIVYVILGTLGTILLAYVVYNLFRRHLALEENYTQKFLLKIKESKWLGITLSIAIAFLVRFILVLVIGLLAGQSSLSYLGYNVEADATKALYMGKFGTVWATEQIAEYAEGLDYIQGQFYPMPIYSYILAFIGVLAKGAANPVLIATVLIKILGSLADLGAIYILYKMLEKKLGSIGTTLMCCFYGLIPMVFSASAIWGLSEALMSFLVILLFYFVLKNKYIGAAITYFIAFMVSTTAIFLAPLMIFYAVNQFIYKKKLRIFIIASFVSALVLYYLFTLPFCYNSVAGGKAFACVTDYYNAIMTNNFYTLNAFNFQALLGNNFKEISTESTFITIIFIVFILALVGVGYFKNKNRMDLLLLSSLTVCMFFTFINRMNPISMYIALVLLFLYATINKEKRVFFIFTMYAMMMFLNTSFVYLVGGYTLISINALSYDGNAIIYVFSALNLLLTAYFVYVAYDIVIVKRAAKIQPMELTYIGSVVNTGKKIALFFQNIKKKLAKAK